MRQLREMNTVGRERPSNDAPLTRLEDDPTFQPAENDLVVVILNQFVLDAVTLQIIEVMLDTFPHQFRIGIIMGACENGQAPVGGKFSNSNHHLQAGSTGLSALDTGIPTRGVL
jgi:hypothetical protein